MPHDGCKLARNRGHTSSSAQVASPAPADEIEPRQFPRFEMESDIMDLTQHVATDVVQEPRLRRWARENYVPLEFRDPSWHPAVLDEMQRKEQELNAESSFCDVARRIVPLVPERGPTLHG